jgi:hypothetical protein
MPESVVTMPESVVTMPESVVTIAGIGGHDRRNRA